jgi:hypothetical protein
MPTRTNDRNAIDWTRLGGNSPRLSNDWCVSLCNCDFITTAKPPTVADWLYRRPPILSKYSAVARSISMSLSFAEDAMRSAYFDRMIQALLSGHECSWRREVHCAERFQVAILAI